VKKVVLYSEESLVRLFAISESRIILDSFLTSALDGTGFRLTPPPLYARGKVCRYSLCRRLGGPHSLSGCFREKEIPSSCHKSNHVSWVVQPVA